MWKLAAPCPADPEVDYGPLLEGVDGLPERFRSVVVLHYFEGLSTEVIAVRLGCAARNRPLAAGPSTARGCASIWSNGAVAPAVLLPAAGEACRLLDSTVPPLLFQATVRSGKCSALASVAVEQLVPDMVARLSRHVAPSPGVQGASAGLARALALDRGCRRRVRHQPSGHR